ncbi:CLUMA_CG021604, isoform A [Clunio marinus]|uniref:CLUMA_CG021604, isoform A n=1 Tax=Clunio marinus TaxID=568069 RepID=A0A1J1J7H9_9DIPT|nr:CLUMA_CG021604, isoform A [Clunio marinus]
MRIKKSPIDYFRTCRDVSDTKGLNVNLLSGESSFAKKKDIFMKCSNNKIITLGEEKCVSTFLRHMKLTQGEEEFTLKCDCENVAQIRGKKVSE